MGKETKSRTEKTTDFVERAFGGHHYKTTISDGHKTVKAEGNKKEEAEKRASKKWNKQLLYVVRLYNYKRFLIPNTDQPIRL